MGKSESFVSLSFYQDLSDALRESETGTGNRKDRLVSTSSEFSSVRSHKRECNLCLVPKFKLPSAAAVCYPTCEAPFFGIFCSPPLTTSKQQGKGEGGTKEGDVQQRGVASSLPNPPSLSLFAHDQKIG